MKLPAFMLERYFAQYEFHVEYPMCCSDCESTSVEELLSFEPGAKERFLSLRLGYTESEGAPSLREAISRIYRTVGRDDVLVHSGAEEAVFLFMQAVLEPGDHIVVHWPCYQSLFQIAQSMGCRVSPWVAKEEKGWALDPDELAALLQPNTRAVIINCPHNPTGYVMERGSFERVVRLADSHGAILFSDEVYRESELDPRERLPAAADISERAVSLGVTSKTYGLPGLRIGWLATHNACVLRSVARLKDYTTICASGPGEVLAEVALRHRERLVEKSVSLIRRNRDLLDAFFTRRKDLFRWQRPSAGPIAFPKLVGQSVASFCDALVKQSGVLLLPGGVYADEGNHFRIGFGRANFPQALERLDNFLAATR